MSARLGKVKEKLALRENSFDGSPDTEFIGLMNDDGSISNVTYKIIPVAAHEETITNMQSSPSHGTYYVSIENPVEVFATNSPTTKLKREDDRRIIRSPPVQQSKASTAKKRDDKRRVTHNEVERRRRCKINTWITKLASLVPNSGTPDTASKGGILAKACDHIVELNEKQKRLEKLELENEKLVLEVLRLNQELTDLRKENSSVRNQLADNCIVFSRIPKNEELEHE